MEILQSPLMLVLQVTVAGQQGMQFVMRPGMPPGSQGATNVSTTTWPAIPEDARYLNFPHETELILILNSKGNYITFYV